MQLRPTFVAGSSFVLGGCGAFVEVHGLGSSGVEAARVVGANGGGGVVSVAGVVDQPVVVATQRDRLIKVGEPAFRPRLLVVQL